MNNPPATPGSRQTQITAAPVAEAPTGARPGALMAPNQPPEPSGLTVPHPK